MNKEELLQKINELLEKEDVEKLNFYYVFIKETIKGE